LTGAGADALRHGLQLALIAASAWLVVEILFVAEDALFLLLRVDVPDKRRARRLRTQIAVVRRLTAATVTVLALAAMFVTFTPLWTLGTSLLALAGVAGVIVGLAAQTALTNVFAGLQLVFTDTLRYDDVVVVEGEWGRVEELTLTTSCSICGTSAGWCCRRPTSPRRPSRTGRALSRGCWVRSCFTWTTGRRSPSCAAKHGVSSKPPRCGTAGTGCCRYHSTPLSMVVRVLASSADAPSSWDLRCEIREGLIEFLKTHHPEAFPRGLP
jgi:hypothetical protein